MNEEQLERQIEGIERALRREDPTLTKFFEALPRQEARRTRAVFMLLTASAVLLAVALATQSAVAAGGGVGAYLLSFVVDSRRELASRGARDSKDSS